MKNKSKKLQKEKIINNFIEELKKRGMNNVPEGYEPIFLKNSNKRVFYLKVN